MNEQIIEVEFDRNKVEEYKSNYIMEEEGIGDIESEPYDKQSTVNEVPFEEMIEEGEVVIDDTNN